MTGLSAHGQAKLCSEPTLLSMNKSTQTAHISDKDRLGLTLFLAVAVHGILILGLSFKAFSDHYRQNTPALNVVLVQSTSNKTPKEASFIAQANELSSGNSNLRGQPGSLFFSPNPSPRTGVSPVPKPNHTPRITTKQPPLHFVASNDSDYNLPSLSNTRGQNNPDPRDNQQLLQLQLQQARLTAEIRLARHNYNRRPRRAFLDTINAKSAVEATYLAHWVRHVERIGDLNYPDTAIRKHLQGHLILNVLISRTGKLLKTVIAHSSGSQILDDAAKRIVRLASPFPPFPEAMRKHYDQILITRTWIFESGQLHTTSTR